MNAAFLYLSLLLPVPLDCSQFDFSQGCRSFNEMVASKDRDVVAVMEGGNESFACFRPDEDVFIIVSFPSFDEKRTVQATPRIMEHPGSLMYTRFKAGISDDFQYSQGTWRRFTNLPSDYTNFYSLPKFPNASIDNSEISIAYTYDNIGGRKTDYSFKIRRSTLRFVEVFEIPSDKKDDKSVTQIKVSGHCSQLTTLKPKT